MYDNFITLSIHLRDFVAFGIVGFGIVAFGIDKFGIMWAYPFLEIVFSNTYHPVDEGDYEGKG